MPLRADEAEFGRSLVPTTGIARVASPVSVYVPAGTAANVKKQGRRDP